MKFKFMAIIFGILLLSGCSSNSNTTSSNVSTTPDSIEVVKKFHEATVEKDPNSFKKLALYNERFKLKELSSKDEVENRLKEIMDSFADTIEVAGGIEKLKYKEIEKKDMEEYDIKRFDEKYNKDWTIVMVNYGEFIEKLDKDQKPGSNLIFFFLKKVDNEYHIVYSEGSKIGGIVKEGRENKYVKLKKD